MQVDFQAKNLLAAIKAVKKMFEKAPVANAGEGHDCLVASKSDGVILESADHGMHVKVQILADVQEQGALVIRRDYLAQIRFQGDSVKFQHKPGSNQLHFGGGSMKGAINVSEDTSEIDAQRPLEIPALTTTIPSSVLREAVKKTCFNTSHTSPLKMRVQLVGNILTLSTNDQFRAAAVRTTIEEHEGECDVVIPAIFFQTVLGSIDDERVRLGFNDRSFRIKGGGIDVTHPVLQEDGPKVADVWAYATKMDGEESLGRCGFKTADAKEAITAIASTLPSKENRNSIELTFSSRQMQVKSRSNLGQADCRIPTDFIEINEKLTFSVDIKFMLEFLGLGNGPVSMKIWDRNIAWWSEDRDAVWFIPQVDASQM